MKSRKTILILLIASGLSGGMMYAGYDRGKPSFQGPEPESEIGAGMYTEVPRSLAELAESADLIVVGKIGPIVREEMYYGFDPGAAKREELDKVGDLHLGLPAVDYSIEVEDTLLENTHLSSDQPPVLRLFGYPGLNTDLPEIGDRYMLFLRWNSDSGTFGPPSVMHWIALDGPTPVVHLGSRDVIPFGMKISPEEFREAVIRVIHAERRTATAPPRAGLRR
jgi:hypothetical protein